MRRQRTVALGKDAVDFMVLEYSCIDNTVLSTIGKHCKETTWKIAAGNGTAPIDIKIHVDKKVMLSPQVRIDWDGTKIFPRGSAAKDKLREDFTWCTPYSGIIKGLGMKNRFEVRPEHGGEDWHAATLTDQRHDGLFTATVQMPDGKGGIKEFSFPAVKPENIREADGTNKAVVIPRRQLLLKVPQQDALSAVLSVDSGQLITHFFARPTPPPSKDPTNGASLVKPRILLKVSRDRERVTSDVGHEVLAHFLRGDVRAVSEEPATRLRKAWSIQVGPFAEHTIEIERRYRSSKVMTLTVDGDVLCESTAEDIDSRPDFWECSFRLDGEKYIDWEVYETDLDGRTLNTMDLVRQKLKCCYQCVLSVPEGAKDLSGAQFSVDNIDFADLPQSRMVMSDGKLDCATEAFLYTYRDLVVPHKLNASAPRGIVGRVQEWTNSISNTKPSGNDDGLGFLARCCGRAQIRPDDITRPHRASKDF